MSTPVFTRVLVGWDGSHASTAGLSLACRLTAFPGGVVTALSVVPAFAHIETAADRARAGADARAPLQACYDQVLAGLPRHPDQQVSLRFVEDEHVAEALDHYAAEQLVDLLVVGLHGREGVVHPKMGHIANHVVKASCCPVLVVPDARDLSGHLHPDRPTHLAAAVRGLFHSPRQQEARR